jgi:hypothetical protein
VSIAVDRHLVLRRDYPVIQQDARLTASRVLLESDRSPDAIDTSFGDVAMCRNIRVLYNFDPPATDEEIRAAALQYVRKISGFTRPSKANEAAFDAAVDEVARVSAKLLAALESSAAPKNREIEAARARARAAQRFAS